MKLTAQELMKIKPLKESSEKILDKLPIKDIEKYLRKKKLKKINKI